MNMGSLCNYSQLGIVIPTKNEEIHIYRAISSALRITNNVVVVDSFSTDKTIEISESLGITVLQYEWTASSNFSKKMNWAFDNLPFKVTWIFRLDADEYLEETTINFLKIRLSQIAPDVNAVALRRRVHFRGKWIRHGGQYPITNIRIIRSGFAVYELQWLDEVVNVQGNKIVYLSLDFIDDSLISLSEWIKKHDRYSNQNAIEMLNLELGFIARTSSKFIGKQSLSAQRKKVLYSKLPLFWRASFYFFIRYFVLLGFIDGVQGFLWHFLQGWWYQTLTDVKIFEIKKACGNDPEKIKSYISMNYNIDL
jgi:glycosyltransferase involved in cell wall biosynthesis